jgi:hypothetical protein
MADAGSAGYVWVVPGWSSRGRRNKDQAAAAAAAADRGNALIRDYERTANARFLRPAIACFREAVTAVPPDHPERSMYLGILGIVLETSFRRTGEPADLDQAIASYTEAATPVSHPARLGSLVRPSPTASRPSPLYHPATRTGPGACPASGSRYGPLHLAAAMQLIGYRHVLATLWSVADSAASALADTIYAHLRHPGPDGPPQADRAPYALHHAVTRLRQDDPDEPLLWAPSIHLGP